MTATYTPAEGSIPARIIAYLRTLPEGVEVRATDLASATDCQAYNLKNYLDAALKHRLVKRVSAGRGNSFYSLVPPDAFDADEQRDGKPLHRTVSASSTAPSGAKRGPSSVFDLGAGTPPPSSWVAPRRKAGSKIGKRSGAAVKKHPKPRAPLVVHEPRVTSVRPIAPAATVPELVCAMFNTGELIVEAPGQPPQRYSTRQVADLIAYLQRFAKAASEP